MIKNMIGGVLSLFVLTACAGDTAEPIETMGQSPAAPAGSPTETIGAMTIEEILAADEGEVTMDLLNNPESVQARFVEAVNDAEYRDSVLGLSTPLGLTDHSLLTYAIQYCDGQVEIPSQWEPAPGDAAVDVDAFADAVQNVADEHLCPHI
jgi:hypothetical protein